MAKLNGMRQAEAELMRQIDTSLKTSVSAYVTRSLLERLFGQEQSDGSAFPKKFQTKTGAKVRKQYERKGWDTEHFLIRTGKSYPLKTKFSNHTLEVWPVGYDILKYHTDRVEWFGLNSNESTHVVELISEDVRRAQRI